jgi:hypothetical protein
MTVGDFCRGRGIARVAFYGALNGNVAAAARVAAILGRETSALLGVSHIDSNFERGVSPARGRTRPSSGRAPTRALHPPAGGVAQLSPAAPSPVTAVEPAASSPKSCSRGRAPRLGEDPQCEGASAALDGGCETRVSHVAKAPTSPTNEGQSVKASACSRVRNPASSRAPASRVPGPCTEAAKNKLNRAGERDRTPLPAARARSKAGAA